MPMLPHPLPEKAPAWSWRSRGPARGFASPQCTCREYSNQELEVLLGGGRWGAGAGGGGASL